MIRKSTLEKIIKMIKKQIDEKLIQKKELLDEIHNLTEEIKIIDEKLNDEMQSVINLVTDTTNSEIRHHYDFASFSKCSKDKIDSIRKNIQLLDNAVEKITAEITDMNIDKKKYEYILEKKIKAENEEAQKQELKLMDEFVTISKANK